MTARPDLAPGSQDDPELAARRRLGRQKRRATLLLVAMGGVMLAAQAVGHGFWAGLLGAGGRAGLVGGLADWFAVTALFRRPLGLPIPHTAILPAQQQRLGRSLGGFLATHVFTEADIGRALARLDVPSLLRAALLDPRVSELARAAVLRLMPLLLDGLEAGRAKELLARLLPRMLGGNELAPVVARALRVLVDGDRHQEVLSFLLDQIKLLLRNREAYLHQLIEERVREQGGRLVGWAIGGQVASRVLSAINVELGRSDQRESDLREAVTAWMRQEIDLIETDPDRARGVGEVLRGLVGHESLRAWGSEIWGRLRAAIDGELGTEGGWVHRLVDDGLARGAALLESDPQARAAVDRAVAALLRMALPGVRDHLARFIAQVLGGWDTARLVERIELRVGGDLQFVRINGTLVGCLVGMLLYLGLAVLFGTHAG